MYNNRRPLHIIYVLTLLLVVCFSSPALAGSGDPQVAKQAWPMIEQGVLLIDVRTPQEFAQGHIDGAVNIPYERTDALMAAIGSDKSRPVVVYCRSGNRSGRAKAALESYGYSHIFNATGYEALKSTKP